jgi:sterol carrier protein 2
VGAVTKLQCCPTSDGAGAAVLASEEFIKKHGLQKNAVEILGMALTTDFRSTFSEKSSMRLVGYDMTKEAARRVYEQSGFGPENVDVVELHDCFSANELMGACPRVPREAWRGSGHEVAPRSR